MKNNEELNQLRESLKDAEDKINQMGSKFSEALKELRDLAKELHK